MNHTEQKRLRRDIKNYLSKELQTQTYPLLITNANDVCQDYRELAYSHLGGYFRLGFAKAFQNICGVAGTMIVDIKSEFFDNLPNSPRAMLNDTDKIGWDNCVSNPAVQSIVVDVTLRAPKMGHQVMLMFDKRTKTCWPFDPQFVSGELHTYTLSARWARSLEKKRKESVDHMWGGFRLVSVESWASRRTESIQDVIGNHGGAWACENICVSITFMILLLCLRFNVPRPAKMASILRDAYRNDAQELANQYRQFISFLHHYLDEFEPPHDQKRLAQILNPSAHPNTHNKRCIVKLLNRAQQCSRTACNGDVYCWQHANQIRDNSTPPAECRQTLEFIKGYNNNHK